MKKILVIEDNVDMLQNIAEILELANYEVLQAADGKQGITMARTYQPDLILCDIMMPGLDGYGVLKVLSSDEKTQKIPFIFLTAKSTLEDMRRGMNLGADDYITKPFDESQLLNAIETRLERYRKIREEDTPASEERRSSPLSLLFNERRAKELLLEQELVGVPHQYRRGDYIFIEDSYPRYVYYVVEGMVKIFTTNQEGKDFVTGLKKKDDFFGYKAMLENVPYIDSAVALTDTELYQIPKDRFFALLTQQRDVAFFFLKLLAHDVQQSKVRLLSLAYDSIRMRVAQALLMLMDNTDRSIRLSRESLSQIVGAAPESVIRTLSDFKDEGLIRIEGRVIYVENEDKLKRIR